MNEQPMETKTTDLQGNLDIISIWDTIQGEGPYAGCPAVFVRLAGCNLQCDYCFGTAVKSRIPYLSMATGPKKRLDKIKIGDEVLTFDDDFNLTTTTINKVHSRIAEEWLTIRINGSVYDVTPEHPFFTKRGLINAEDLNVGDCVLEVKPHEVIAWKKTGDRNPMKDPVVAKRSADNTDYAAQGLSVAAAIQKRKDEGSYVSSWDSMTEAQRTIARHNHSEAKKGSKNPNWTGGPPPNLTQLLRKIKSKEITKCKECMQEKDRLLVHHHNEDRDDDTQDNLIVWCHQCHNQYHQRGWNFWNGARSDGKQLVDQHNGQLVESITRCSGQMPVVNVSCEPHNTFLANGMWVHNCDTDYTSNRTWLSPEELCGEVKGIRPLGLVVLTGGEPFRQNIGPAVKMLLDAGYEVQIETNGTLHQREIPWSHKNLTIVCSPKTAKLHHVTEMFIDAYKYVVEDGYIGKGDGLPTRVLGSQTHIARPHDNFTGDIFIQPMDSKDAAQNKLNTECAVAVCQKFGYRFCLQVQKIIGVE